MLINIEKQKINNDQTFSKKDISTNYQKQLAIVHSDFFDGNESY